MAEGAFEIALSFHRPIVLARAVCKFETKPFSRSDVQGAYVPDCSLLFILSFDGLPNLDVEIGHLE